MNNLEITAVLNLPLSQSQLRKHRRYFSPSAAKETSRSSANLSISSGYVSSSYGCG
jgi:hypothetical protein